MSDLQTKILAIQLAAEAEIERQFGRPMPMLIVVGLMQEKKDLAIGSNMNSPEMMKQFLDYTLAMVSSEKGEYRIHETGNG